MLRLLYRRTVSAGFVASALESVGRLAEGYLGQAWLDGFNRAAYFPVILISFGTLAVWLWKQAKGSATGQEFTQIATSLTLE